MEDYDMKIVNICNKSYIDGWGYQENLLPEYEAKAGHEVVVIGSANHFISYVDEKKRKEILDKGKDYFFNNVHVIRKNTYIETTYLSFFCTGIYRTLKKEKPGMVFVHNINASTMVVSAIYTLFHRDCKMYVDNHEDGLNRSNNVLWNMFVKKGLLRIICGASSCVISKFYGVTPSRCEYLHNTFGVSLNNINLLPLGGDTDMVDMIQDDIPTLRKKYSLPVDAFILCCGGKMAKWKGTENLISAFKEIRGNKDNIILLFFGKFEDKETEEYAMRTEGIILYQWLDRKSSLEVLKLSDVAIWPLHHTTLIDDAVSCGTPIIVRRTGNTSHLIEENGIFLENGNVEEIVNAVNKMIAYNDLYVQKAFTMKNRYSYHSIVQQLMDDYYKDSKKK